MPEYRIRNHPIIDTQDLREDITFYWNKSPLKAKRGEVIASALFANGIKIFGHHYKDDSAQGMFCANGQCAKCLVTANGFPVKSCMVEVQENMIIESLEGLPELPDVDNVTQMKPIEESEVEVLIIGGGPAGLSAAIELGQKNISTLIIDDKSKPGGKLVLQTHKFFGSVEDSYAGTRGIDIGDYLAEKLQSCKTVDVWTDSTALFVFKDKKVGILKKNQYWLVKPKIILNAAGAREKFLVFPGNHLTGIYGAGAFQTLVNRDLVKPSERLFVIGGGNVGLIAAYHALQAGINVVGLAEAMPECGGYKVHADKLMRLGVPIYTSHTVLCANGTEKVESITISQINQKFELIPETEKTFDCDTILIAVGLESLSEFTSEAETAGIKVLSAGDASEIAEASSAMFNGKITGIIIAKELGITDSSIPDSWYEKAEILKRHPGKIFPQVNPDFEEGVFPIIHCVQEIPCNPCSTVCPTNSIMLREDPIMGIPYYEGSCIGCGKCVLICPGLAITLVDYRKSDDHVIVTVPYEVGNVKVERKEVVEAVDISGNFIEKTEVIAVVKNKKLKTDMVKLKASPENAKKIVSFKIQADEVSRPLQDSVIKNKLKDGAYICLCERVTVKDIKNQIKKGITDLNHLKAVTRLGMGPCGSKTCDSLVKRIMREEGIKVDEVVENTKRPLFVEVDLGTFAAEDKGDRDE